MAATTRVRSAATYSTSPRRRTSPTSPSTEYRDAEDADGSDLVAGRALLSRSPSSSAPNSSAERRRLPMVRIDKAYVFDGPDGRSTLLDLFAERRQLLVYHFMFDPAWDAGCQRVQLRLPVPRATRRQSHTQQNGCRACHHDGPCLLESTPGIRSHQSMTSTVTSPPSRRLSCSSGAS
ncbi:DUF899 family protein [Nonomuraea sp. NPDC049480]|uniref:DUF899 family protein n=1 Tax=Nonomuraea sp. NPDC049480 TaxID=3364353 RepID=UPI0037BE1BBF